MSNPQAITSGTSDPNATESDRFYSTNLFGTWTHVASSNLLMQVHLGVDRFSWYIYRATAPEGFPGLRICD